MYTPNFVLSHTIINNLIKLETEKATTELQKLEDQVAAEMKARAKALNLFHLGHLIGVNLTLKDAEKIAEGKRIHTEDARGVILTNFRNVIEFVRSSVSDSYVDIDLNILLHLNKLMLTDWREPWEAKFRTGGEQVDSSFDSWLDIRDKNIDPVNIENELNELINWYKSNSTKINPTIRIAVFLYRLLRISPFMVLNKITVIAVADYLLYKNSYIQKTFVPTTRNFDIYEDEYLEAWTNAVQGSLDTESQQAADLDNVTLWIERFSRNLSNDIQEVKTVLREKVHEETKSAKQPFLDLNKRQLKILRYLQTIPTVKREDYVQMMDVSTMTAFRDLSDLVEKKLLRIEGRGRGTKYMLRSR
jgi:hypothetical protein